MPSHIFLKALGPEIILGSVAILLALSNRISSLPDKIIKFLIFSSTIISSWSCFSDLLERAIILDNIYIYNRYTVYFKLILLAFLALTVLASVPVNNRFASLRTERYVFMMFSIVGAMVLAGAVDLFLFYVSLELMMTAILFLIFFETAEYRHAESIRRFLFLQFAGSASILFGISLIFSCVGSTNYFLIQEYLSKSHGMPSVAMVMGGSVFSVLGLMVKTGVIPFHGCLIEMIGLISRPSLSLIILSCSIGFFSAISRMCCTMIWQYRTIWMPISGGLAALIMIAGCFEVTGESDLFKKCQLWILGQQGFLLAGLATLIRYVPIEGLPGGLAAALFSLMTVSVSAACLIFPGLRDTQKPGYNSPVPGVALLSISGMPLTMGFMGIFYLVSAAIHMDQHWLAILIIITSLVSASQFIPMIFRSDSWKVTWNTATGVTTILFSIIIISLGVFPEFFSEAVRIISKAIWI
jgi:NADH-quinone oxidoreductase subunit N